MKLPYPLLCLTVALTACVTPPVEDGWQRFENKEAGVAVSYPQDANIDIRINRIEGLADTMGFNEQTAKLNRYALSKQSFGEPVDFSLESSQSVVPIGSGFAQDATVLRRFEVCDITFDRVLYFFHRGHQIVVTLSGPTEEIVKESPAFFKTYYPECADDLMWDDDLMDEFYTTIKLGRGGDQAQLWFDTFEDIVETIRLQ